MLAERGVTDILEGRRSGIAGGNSSQPLAHPRVRQLDALTSLRAFAALYVLAFHYRGFFGTSKHTVFFDIGFSGVTFFFLLSGFILSHNYKNVDFSDRRNVVTFAAARVARIYPVFLVSLLCGIPFLLAAVPKMPSALEGPAWASLVLAPLGLHAWVPGAACALNCPSWSISTEFFFYICFPFLFAWILRSPLRWAGAAVAMWTVFGVLYLLVWGRLSAGGSVIEPDPADGAVAQIVAEWIKFFPAGRLAEFLGGILLYVLWDKRLKTVSPVPFLMIFVMVGAGLVAVADHLPLILLHNGLTALAWAPLLLAGAQMSGGPLFHPVFVFLGRISFSLYLFHGPVYLVVNVLDRRVLDHKLASIPWTAAVGSGVLALAVAGAAFLLVEEPCRRAIAQWSRRYLRRVVLRPSPSEAV